VRDKRKRDVASRFERLLFVCRRRESARSVNLPLSINILSCITKESWFVSGQQRSGKKKREISSCFIHSFCNRYGPFWISSTLIFTLAVTGNVGAYLSSEVNTGPDVSKLRSVSFVSFLSSSDRLFFFLFLFLFIAVSPHHLSMAISASYLRSPTLLQNTCQPRCPSHWWTTYAFTDIHCLYSFQLQYVSISLSLSLS
jgi:hypothetical protein